MVRWALVADLMLLFGVPLFAVYVSSSPIAKIWHGLRHLIFATATLGVALSMLGIVIVAASMSGVAIVEVDAASISMVVTKMTVGKAFLFRFAALAVAMALGLRSSSNRIIVWLIVMLGAIALGSLAWSGHGVMDDGLTGLIHLIADIVHLLAAGVWVGALASLLWQLVTTGHASASEAHRALAGFARIGTASVALVLISGSINVWLLVGPDNLLSLGQSLYGQLLLIKLALFAGMLSLAALNRFRLTPGLGVAVRSNGEAATQRLRLSLTLETFAAVTILGLVAWLGTLEPPVSVL